LASDENASKPFRAPAPRYGTAQLNPSSAA